MTDKGIGAIVRVAALAAAVAAAAPSCDREKSDNAEERAVCDELSDKLCAKWFDCWPLASANVWGDLETCVLTIRATCSNGDELYECDMDNADLVDCNDNVEGSTCGDLPQSCSDS